MRVDETRENVLDRTPKAVERNRHYQNDQEIEKTEKDSGPNDHVLG